MTMPSAEDDGGPNWFDRFANHASKLVSHAVFFSLCVAMVVLWFPTLFFMPVDSSQLIINTSTTIVTFLLVALLENTSKRGNDAIQAKLNAIAKALALVMEDMDCETEANELRKAVGLEEREGT
jgi:low affinity Fe/Cu permease